MVTGNKDKYNYNYKLSDKNQKVAQLVFKITGIPLAICSPRKIQHMW